MSYKASSTISQIQGSRYPFPQDFCSMLPLYRDTTIGLSLGMRGYHESRRVKSRGSQKQESPPVAVHLLLTEEHVLLSAT
jgi:hypothetical protein